MNDYHPNLDGPAEPVGLTMSKNTMNTDNLSKESPCSAWYPLFKHMLDEHGLTLLDDELANIASKVSECRDGATQELENNSLRRENDKLRGDCQALGRERDQFKEFVENLELRVSPRP